MILHSKLLPVYYIVTTSSYFCFILFSQYFYFQILIQSVKYYEHSASNMQPLLRELVYCMVFDVCIYVLQTKTQTVWYG